MGNLLTLKVLDKPPEDLKTGESWDDLSDLCLVPCAQNARSDLGRGTIMVHATGWMVYVKPPVLRQRSGVRSYNLASTHEIRKFSVPQLETLMGFDVLPKGTMVRVPMTDVADAALKVVAAANAVKEFPWRALE